jgi:DNA-binding PadR family transcriptional regulator
MKQHVLEAVHWRFIPISVPVSIRSVRLFPGSLRSAVCIRIILVKIDTDRASLSVILLGMLFDEPMHAYRMQKSIKQKGVDKIVNVRQRASVYQALERLLRLGLIEVQETVQVQEAVQTGNHPDRVIYAITDQGREMAVAWLPRMLATVSADFPRFPAAVSLLAMLSPDEARKHFEFRADAVRNELSRLGAEKLKAAELPRLSLLNNEYQTALLRAELAWIQAVIDDLTSGSFVWGNRRIGQFESSGNGGM